MWAGQAAHTPAIWSNLTWPKGQVRCGRPTGAPPSLALYAQGHVECRDVAVGRAGRDEPAPRGRRDWVLRRDRAWRSRRRKQSCVPTWSGRRSHLPSGAAWRLRFLFRRTHPLMAVAFAFGTFAVVDIGMAIADLEPDGVLQRGRRAGACLLAVPVGRRPRHRRRARCHRHRLRRQRPHRLHRGSGHDRRAGLCCCSRPRSG